MSSYGDLKRLRTALTSKQLVVHFQPKIDLRTGDVHDVEALVRWEHPTRGLLYPDAFLNLAEESGLMPELTRVVVALSLDQVAVWQRQGQWMTVAVHLSASAILDADLPDDVAAMLAARELPPGALKLEITEEFLLSDADRALDILIRLRRHGVQISIDDDGAGTGIESLSYLPELPIDELKLGRSFISPMAGDVHAAARVASTIGMAHSLDLRLVAEGVENNLAYALLMRLGCDQAQGYFMSRPVSAIELNNRLSSRNAAYNHSDIHQLRSWTPVEETPAPK
jgi:diguanylate cyclase